jgi:hypothetical protein
MFYKQSEATAARRKFTFVCVDDTDGKTPETGLTFSGSEVSVRKGTATTYTALTNIGSIVEIAHGEYQGEFTAAELSDLAHMHVKVNKTGVRLTVLQVGQVVPWDPYDSVRLGLTALPNAAAAASGGLYTIGAANVAAEVWGAVVASYATAGTFGELTQVLAGLLHLNSRIDNTTYNGNGLLTAARLRVFASAALANAAVDGAADGANSETQRYAIVSTDEGDGKLASYKLTRTL